MTNPNNLEIKRPAIFFILLLVIIFVFIIVASLADKSRKEKVWQSYGKEAEVYIKANKNGLLTIFTDIFPANCTNNLRASLCDGEAGLRGVKIAGLINNNLKDFSSTMFLKKWAGAKSLIMRLSGEVIEPYMYDNSKQKLVDDLLEGKIDKAPWDEYFYELRTKEILIPVKDGQNKTIGILVRGVIE